MTDVRCHCGRVVGVCWWSGKLTLYMKVGAGFSPPPDGPQATIRMKRLGQRLIRRNYGMLGPVDLGDAANVPFHCRHHGTVNAEVSELEKAARASIRRLRLPLVSIRSEY